MRRSSTKTRNCQTTRTTERGEERLRTADAFLVKSRMRLRIGRRRAARRLFAHLAHRPMLGVPHMQHILSHSHALLSEWTVRAVELQLEALLLFSVGGNVCSSLRAAAAVRRAAGPRAPGPCLREPALPAAQAHFILQHDHESHFVPPASAARRRRRGAPGPRCPGPRRASGGAVAAGGARRRDELKTFLFVTQPPRTHVSYTQRTPDTYKIYAPTTPRTRRRSRKHGTPTAAYAFAHVTRVPHVVVER